MRVKIDVLQPLSLWLITGNRVATNIAKKSNSNEEHTGEPDAGKLHVRFDEGFRRESIALQQPPVEPTLPVKK